MTRDNKDLKGIPINGIEHKISQYADDTEFMLDGKKKSFESCMTVLSKFGKRSGLFLNHGKTSVIWLGCRKGSQVKYMEHLGMEWNPSKFKVLGIWFTNDGKGCERLNYTEKFEEMKKLIQLWMKRLITPLGRVAILKSLILSKLIHLWMWLPNPSQVSLDALQKICFVFIWREKQDRINRKTAQQHEKNGGLGVPNLKSFAMSLKLSWLRKYQFTNHKWRNIASSCYPFLNNIEKYGPGITNSGNMDPNPFWSDVFEAYRTIYAKIEPACVRELLSEPILFNKARLLTELT